MIFQSSAMSCRLRPWTTTAASPKRHVWWKVSCSPLLLLFYIRFGGSCTRRKRERKRHRTGEPYGNLRKTSWAFTGCVHTQRQLVLHAWIGRIFRNRQHEPDLHLVLSPLLLPTHPAPSFSFFLCSVWLPESHGRCWWGMR